MKKLMHQWFKTYGVILTNAGSLIGTTVVTSGLGFVFWWLAARRFPLEAVGLAAASISAMTLLGNLCMLGLGTLLITELPRQPGQEGSLITTALIMVGGTGGCIGVLFAILAPSISVEFLSLGANITNILIFATGVSFTSITLVLDQALVGLLSGDLQLWRNTLFAIAKLVALFLVSFWLSYEAGITIYATWAVGNAFSLATLAGVALWKGKWSGRIYLPQWGLLRKLGAAALQHHLLNLALQAPSIVLPLLVTVLLSAKMNAWFYVSSMIASFVFMVPYALTNVLHAINSAQQSALGHKARVTMGIALVVCIVANCILQFDTKQVLGLFGSSYAEQATWSLRILALQAFPLIIKTHYIAICRIRDRIASAMVGMLLGGLLELVLAVLGAHFGGLSGMCLGQTTAVYVESIFMFRTVYKAIRSVGTTPSIPTRQEIQGVNPIWLLDTSILMAIKQSYKLRAVQSKVSKQEIYLETEANLCKKPEQRSGTNKHSNIDKLRLKANRLEHYTSDYYDTHVTEIDTNESSFE